MKRMRDLIRHDPQLKACNTSREDLAWIKQGGQAAELLARACQRYADRPCLATRQPDTDYQAISYSQLWARVLALADGLQKEGWVTRGDLVGICGFCSVDWAVADLACLCLGAVSVPLDSGISELDFVHVLSETQLSCLISDYQPLARLAPALADCPSLKSVLAIRLPEEERHRSLELSARWGWLDHVESAGERATPAVPAGPEELFSVVYTSGSTGPPKGVMLTHGRWVQTLQDALERAAVPRLTVGYLPLSHMAGRITLYATMMGGGSVSMVTRSDMSTLLDDIRRARPTHLLLVPRVSGLLYQHFQLEMLRRGLSGALDDLLADPVGQKVCLEMRSDLLGGRLCFVHTGAAPTPPEVSKFLWRGLAVHVTDLYGSTEMGPVTINGKVHDYIQYRLIDRPQLGFRLTDKPYPRGELAVKSPRATTGYYNNPKATENLHHDGYLLTGDIVEERAPGQLVWLDRRQNVLRLAHGEFVNASRLEELFWSQSPFIEQAYLYGNPLYSYLLAVLVPSAAAVERAGDSTEQRALLRQELARVAAQAGLKSHESPRDFLLESSPFSQENGLLSSSNKPRRPHLKTAYGPRLDELYLEIEKRQKGRLADPSLSLPDKLREAVALTLGLESVETGSSSFVHLGGDSLAAVRLSELLRQSCDLEVSVGDLLDPTASLASLLARSKPASPAPSLERAHGQDATWANAADLSSLLEGHHGPPGSPATERALDAPQIVLLTGANGFLGRFLALQLAARLPDSGRLVCLVRAGSDAEARQRMTECYATTEARELFRQHEPKLEILAGDLSRPGLGLEGQVLARLGTEVESIVHCGALVNHALPYAHLFECNVAGTAEIVKLAHHTGRPKAICFLSTIGLGAGRFGRNPATEAETASQLWPRRPINPVAASYAQGYVTSKWAGEVLLEHAHRRSGLPVTIARCSLILPHSSWPGELNAQDMLTRLLYGLRKTGLAPTSMGSPQPLDGLPVDLVAGFLGALATQAAQGLKIYHVCHSAKSGLSMDGIVEQASRHWSCETIEPGEFWPLFRLRLAGLPPQEQRLSPLAILQRWEKGGKGELRLDNSQFLAKLHELAVDEGFPQLDQTYLQRSLLAPLGTPSP